MIFSTMKAITPVIALVMLLLITVGITGASYSWFGGLMSSQTKKPITIPPGGAYCSDGDIKVYALNNGDTALTASDIIVAQVDGVDIKNTPFFGDMRSGLVGYWKFDEAGGTTARDSSGNNNNGDLKPLCPNCPEWKTGRSRNALQFDGVNDYVNVIDSASLDIANDITVALWAYPKQVPHNSWQGFSYKGQGGTNNWHFGIESVSGKLSGGFGDGADWDTSISTYVVPQDQWIHLVLVGKANDFIKMYSNGNEIYSSSLAHGFQTNNNDLFIGQGYAPAAEFFNGAIDEVKIYNKAAGDVNIQPGRSGLIVSYPGVEGKHTARIATSSNAAEASVAC